ncbi:MAG: ATP-binding cassette domain-containing protein, partial [Anaerolineaceae bacterium]|nr:ATP-binding cassette domain-containing protein [Anaerolineaceae bacterium]
NGSGKTTLAYSINGLIPGQYHGVKLGEVLVYGTEVEKYDKGALQQKVGMVFSDPEAQFTAMTVEDELVFGLENLGMSLQEIVERLEWVVELTGLAPLLEKPPYELSGGQKQRVAVGAVLAMTPEVMILDEPTSMLDPISRTRVFDVLEKTKRNNNNTIIVVEHSLEKLVPLADRILLLHDGEVIMFHETQKLFENMSLLLEKGIDPPGVLRFYYELSQAGDYSGQLPLTVDEGVELLGKLFNSAKIDHRPVQ